MNNKGEPSIIFSLLSLKRKKWIRFKKIFATPSIQTLVNISVNFGWNNNLKILVTWHKHLVSVYVKWVIGFNWILLLHILSFKTKNAAALWDLLFSWWRGGTQVWTEFDANTWGHILYLPNLCKKKKKKNKPTQLLSLFFILTLLPHSHIFDNRWVGSFHPPSDSELGVLQFGSVLTASTFRIESTA